MDEKGGGEGECDRVGDVETRRKVDGRVQGVGCRVERHVWVEDCSYIVHLTKSIRTLCRVDRDVCRIPRLKSVSSSCRLKEAASDRTHIGEVKDGCENPVK